MVSSDFANDSKSSSNITTETGTTAACLDAAMKAMFVNNSSGASKERPSLCRTDSQYYAIHTLHSNNMHKLTLTLV